MADENFTVDNGLTVTGAGGNITGANNITAANSIVVNGAAGDITMTNGNITGFNSLVGNTANITMTAGEVSWIFDTTTRFQIPNNGVISTPDAAGGDGGANVNILGGASDPNVWNTNPGGNVNIQGGYGSYNDGTGAIGGAVNIFGGLSPENNTGNVNIFTGNTNPQYSWVFDNSGLLTVAGGIDAQQGNDMNVRVFNPNSSGGVTFLVQNYNVDIDNRTTQFEVQPANIVLSTDFNNNRYQWKFDDTGNLTLPTNAFTINYANGTQVPLGGSSYGDSNVVTLLGSFGSNSISTTGNVYAGAGRFTGSFLEADATTAGMFMGYAGGTPRVMFATGTTGQTFEIDNDGGNLRFYQPGSTKATLTSGGDFSVAGNVTATNIGNISAINLTGSTSNILYGNGVFAPVSAPTSIANCTSNVAIAASGGNVVTTVGSAAILTVYSGGIKVAGSGILQSPGGASAITLNNNGANIPTANITTFANITGAGNALNVVNSANIGGNLSVSGNISGNTNGFEIGYLNIPQIAASNTTLAATDGGKHYYSTTAGNFTLTVPNSATTTFATGTAISIVVQAAGNILVNAASGVTLYMAGNSTAANRVVGAYGMATIMKVASDTWFINGTGVS